MVKINSFKVKKKKTTKLTKIKNSVEELSVATTLPEDHDSNIPSV